MGSYSGEGTVLEIIVGTPFLLTALAVFAALIFWYTTVMHQRGHRDQRDSINIHKFTIMMLGNHENHWVVWACTKYLPERSVLSTHHARHVMHAKGE